MFKWLFGKRAEDDTSSVETTEPGFNDGVEQIESSKPVAAQPPQSSEASPTLPPPVANGETTVEAVGLNPAARTRLRAVSGEAEDQPPQVGADAIIVTPSKQQEAKVVRVQAGGRRVVAAIANARAARVYLRRSDGTYRPEGAPSRIASRLVIGGNI